MAFGCERYTDRTSERTKRSGPFDLNRGYLSISLASCLLLICTTNPALKIECLNIPFDSIRLAMQRFACSVWLRWYIRTKWIRFFLHRSHDLSAIKKTALNSTRCFFFCCFIQSLFCCFRFCVVCFLYAVIVRWNFPASVWPCKLHERIYQCIVWHRCEMKKFARERSI